MDSVKAPGLTPLQRIKSTEESEQSSDLTASRAAVLYEIKTTTRRRGVASELEDVGPDQGGDDPHG
jgi:hypothetical protein